MITHDATILLSPDVAPCDLCGVSTPAAWLQPEPYQEWDALCPRCFCRAVAISWQEHAQAQRRPEDAHG